MKTLNIQVEDEEHTRIKLEATKAGVSIKEYLLGGSYRELMTLQTTSPVVLKDKVDKRVAELIKTPEDAVRAIEAIPTPDNWEGPILKKGKK